MLTSPWRRSSTESTDQMLCVILYWESMTAFARPDVPEVKRITESASPSTGSARYAAFASSSASPSARRAAVER